MASSTGAGWTEVCRQLGGASSWCWDRTSGKVHTSYCSLKPVNVPWALKFSVSPAVWSQCSHHKVSDLTLAYEPRTCKATWWGMKEKKYNKQKRAEQEERIKNKIRKLKSLLGKIKTKWNKFKKHKNKNIKNFILIFKKIKTIKNFLVFPLSVSLPLQWATSNLLLPRRASRTSR